MPLWIAPVGQLLPAVVFMALSAEAGKSSWRTAPAETGAEMHRHRGQLLWDRCERWCSTEDSSQQLLVEGVERPSFDRNCHFNSSCGTSYSSCGVARDGKEGPVADLTTFEVHRSGITKMTDSGVSCLSISYCVVFYKDLFQFSFLHDPILIWSSQFFTLPSKSRFSRPPSPNQLPTVIILAESNQCCHALL